MTTYYFNKKQECCFFKGNTINIRPLKSILGLFALARKYGHERPKLIFVPNMLIGEFRPFGTNNVPNY